MKITKKLAICWFKDKRYDKTVFDANTIRRLGKLGIITTNRRKA